MKRFFARSLILLMIIFLIMMATCAERGVDDVMLTARIKTRMAADGRISPTRVNVDTVNGAVTLRGEVPTQQEKDAAEQVARAVEGVASVGNQITVNPAVAGSGIPTGNEIKEQAERALGDVNQDVKREAGETFLLGKIKARLAAAGYGDVGVDVEQGVATLSGETASEKDRIAVEAIVEKVEGVTKVNNRLAVKGHSPAHTPSP